MLIPATELYLWLLQFLPLCLIPRPLRWKENEITQGISSSTQECVGEREKGTGGWKKGMRGRRKESKRDKSYKPVDRERKKRGRGTEKEECTLAWKQVMEVHACGWGALCNYFLCWFIFQGLILCLCFPSSPLSSLCSSSNKIFFFVINQTSQRMQLTLACLTKPTAMTLSGWWV